MSSKFSKWILTYSSILIAFSLGIYIVNSEDAIESQYLYYTLMIIITLSIYLISKHKLLSAFIVITILFGVLYILMTPITSPVDEGAHYDYIRKMNTFKLPTLFDTIDAGLLSSISQYSVPYGTQYEAVHPPLYYFVTSLLTKVVYSTPIVQFVSIRFFGLGMLVGSLCFLLKTVKFLGQRTSLEYLDVLGFGVLSLLILNPGIITRMSTISNESLTVFLFCAATYILVKMSFEPQIKTRKVVSISVVAAALILTKLTTAYIVALIVLLLTLKKHYRQIFLFLLIVFLICLPWLIFNIYTYRTLTATSLHVEFVKQIVNPGNENFGFLFLMDQLFQLFTYFFIPQEYYYQSLPQPMLMVVMALSTIMIVLVLYASRITLRFSTINGIENRVLLITALSVLLNIALLAYGTTSQDVNVMIGRYMYINVIPIFILLVHLTKMAIMDKYHVFIGIFFSALTSIMLTSSIFYYSHSEWNLITKMKQIPLERVSIENLETAMKQKTLEIPDLGSIPINLGSQFEWGNDSYKLNNENLVMTHSIEVLKNEHYQITGDDPHIVFEVDSEVVAGENYLLAIDNRGTDERVVTGQVFWASTLESFNEQNSYKFLLQNGKLLVPVGKYVQWFGNDTIKYIRFDVEGLNINEEFNISIKMVTVKSLE